MSFQEDATLMRNILEILANSYLPLRSLKTCRHVCRTWNIAALPVLLENTTLDFAGTLTKDEFFDLNMRLNFKEFCPPKNIRISMEDEISCRDVKKESGKVGVNILYRYFLEPHGKHIRKMHIDSWSAVTPISSMKMFMDILAVPSHLEELHLCTFPDQVCQVSGISQSGINWPSLPCLKTIVLNGETKASEGLLEGLFYAIASRLNNLCVMNGCPSFMHNFFKCLETVSLPSLENLMIKESDVDDALCPVSWGSRPTGLYITGCRSTELINSALLQAFRETLVDVTIQVTASNIEQTIDCGKSQMNNVKTLRVAGWRKKPLRWNFDFLHQFPNLDTMLLKCWNPEKLSLDETKKAFREWVVINTTRHAPSICNTIKKVILPNICIPRYEHQSFERLLKNFSILHYLEFAATDQALKCVIRVCQTVSVLCISSESIVTDHGITGLGRRTMERETINRETEIQCMTNGIAAMSGLRKLVLNGLHGNITNCSITFGLSKMPLLQKVTFIKCRVTDEGIFELQNVQVQVIDN